MAVNYGMMQATIIPGANIEANIGVSGPPSDDYENLRNKPQINGYTLIGNKTNSELGIPTKTSDLDNDSDFVSDASYVHTDNNYTDAEVSKLEGIEAGAEVNVQSDWEQSDSTADDYIKNKPENLVQDANYVHTDNNYTSDEKSKLSGIEAGAEANVQSDWSEADNSKDDFIKNKPTKVSDFQNDSGFITKDVDDLTNYYKKSETYTQTEINNSLSGKVDKETGKGLSSNDYTDAEKTKLSGIAAGAEVNVQSDWQQSDNTKDDYIKNKPENLVQDASYVHTDNNYTSDEKSKLSGIAAGAEVNVQSDWNQASSSAADYIKNKPENLVQDASYVHTDNNYTTTEKNKLASLNTLMGTTNISGIGDGTVTGALDAFANTVVGLFDYDGATGKLYYEAFLGSPYVFSLNNGILSVDKA